MLEYLCKNCQTSFYRYNSAVTLCGKCSYNRYAKKAKPIKKVGKVAKAWIEYRKEWFVKYPPTNGFYTCGICLMPVHINETVLDHVVPRSNRPDLRYIDSNIQPTHYICNSKKGSKH